MSKKLINEIEALALDESKPITRALRLCITLSGNAQCVKLRDWALKELNGYRDEKIPEYREIYAPIYVDFQDMRQRVSGARFSASALPDFARDSVKEPIRIRQRVSEIVDGIASSKENEIKFGLPGSPELVLLMNASGEYNASISDIYYKVHSSALGGVVDHVRTILVALCAELRAMDWDESNPDTKKLDQAVNIAIYGESRDVNVRVNLNNSGEIENNVTHTEGWNTMQKVGIWAGVVAAAVAVIGLPIAVMSM